MSTIPTFLHVARGNRAENYMRLKLDEPGQLKFGADYSYIELPLAPILDDGEVVKKALRNQTLALSAPAHIQPLQSYKVGVSVNPALSEYANLPLFYIVDYADEPVRLQVYAQFRRDMPLELPWLFRLYLLS